MEKTPKGFVVGGLVDVAGTAKELQALWSRFEDRFPAQHGNEPAMKGRQAIWYTRNGKGKRTKALKLFEKLALELGGLAGDVRELEPIKDYAKPAPKARKKSKR